MKKTIFLLLFILFSLQSYTQSINEKIVEALDDVSNNRFELAIAKFDTLIAEYPNAIGLYILKGEAYSKLVNRYTVDTSSYNNAMLCFNKALELDSTSFEAHRSIGVLNIFHQRFKIALNSFSKAIEYSPTKEDLFNSITDRGAALLYLKEYDKAIKDYERALEIAPNTASVYSNLAIIYKRKSDLEKAREYCDKGLKIEPDNENLLNNLGLINIDEKKYLEADQLFSKILSRNPANPVALSNRGFAKTKLGDFPNALEDLNKSIKLYPENSYAFKNRAILFIETENIEKACQDLNTAHRLGYSAMYGSEVDQLLKDNCK